MLVGERRLVQRAGDATSWHAASHHATMSHELRLVCLAELDDELTLAFVALLHFFLETMLKAQLLLENVWHVLVRTQ